MFTEGEWYTVYLMEAKDTKGIHSSEPISKMIEPTLSLSFSNIKVFY